MNKICIELSMAITLHSMPYLTIFISLLDVPAIYSQVIRKDKIIIEHNLLVDCDCHLNF